MPTHRCPQMQEAISKITVHYGRDWNIVPVEHGFELEVESEYGIQINFCPFCGENLVASITEPRPQG